MNSDQITPSPLTAYNGFKILLGTAGLVLLLFLTCLEVHGQELANEAGVLEEIIVTATKRSESVQDVAFSVSALSGDYLEAIDATSFTDFINLVPGLNLSSPGRAGEKAVNIRGLTPLGNGDNEFATVGFYVDGVPVSDAGFIPDFALFDVNRVEVLRGPQGTLFGEGSLGGTVRIVSNQPDASAYAGKGHMTISSTHSGSQNYRFAGMLNMPLVEDELGLRMVAGYIQDGGFIDNLTTGGEDVNDFETRYLRVALGYTPTEKLSIQAGITYQSTDGREASHDQSNTPDLTFTRAIDGDYNDDTTLASLVIDYDFGGKVLTSATSYFDREFDRIFDDPFTAAAVSGLFGFSIPSVIFQDNSPADTFTQEVRLASENDGRLTWLVGFFYRDQNQKIQAPVTVPLLGDLLVFNLYQDINRKHKALFGEATFDLTDRLHLTGGVRAAREDIDATTELFLIGAPTVALTPEIDEDDVIFKGSLSYNINSDAMIYGTYSEGFRPGGVNARLFTPTIPISYASDSVENYEIGAKTMWAEGRVIANAALYHIDWSDVQLADFSGGAANFTTNAGSADIDGAELELNAAPSEGWLLGLNFSYIDSEFQEDVFSEFTGVQLTSAGEPLPFAPEISYNVFAKYEFPLGSSTYLGFGRVDYAYVDESRTDLGLSGTSTSVPSYQILDLRAGVTKGNWSVTVFVTNLTDERATLNLIDPVYEGAYRNQPRTFGVSVLATF